MKIVPFIFNWPGQFQQACASEASLGALFDRVMVINSDEQNTRPGWVDIGNEAFFSAQFLKAVDLFDGDILFHLQADATYGNWRGVVQRALWAFERCRWGVYAPNVDWSAWKSPGSDLATPFKEDTDLRAIACTDCTCWMIHRDILRAFAGLRHHFERSKFGWGIDITICAVAYNAGRPVLRDYRHTVDHPKGRGYDTAGARSEFERFLGGADPALSRTLDHILHDKKQLQQHLGWIDTLRENGTP